MLQAHAGVRAQGCMRWLVVAGGMAMSTRGWAQGPVDGAIRGHVSAVCGSNAQGCVAGEVRVHVTSPDQGVERDVDADSKGDFLLLRLPPGEYELRATSRTGGQGVAGIAVARLDLEGGDFVEVTLTLGAPRPSGVPLLSLRGIGGEAYDPAALDLAKQLDALPLESRRWENLLELDSDTSEEASATQTVESASDDEGDPASRVSAQDGAAATGMSYAGLSSTQGEFSLDGLSGDQSFRSGPRGSATGGASSGASYNQGSVKSFRVLPRNFSAQYGMVGGMAVVSREAGSVLHGAAFVRARESAWAATNGFSVATEYHNGVVTSEAVKPQGSQVLFGGSVGVPLGKSGGRKSRRGRSRFQEAMGGGEPLSLFASVEEALRDDHIVSTPATANFYNLSQEQIALLANRGVGGAATNAALEYLESLTGTTERQAYRVMGTVRVDASLTARDHVTATYLGNRFDSPSGAALGQASDAVVARGMGSLGDSVVHVDVGSGRWLHGFSKNMNNEVRGQVAHDLDYQTPHGPLPQEPAIGPYGYAPQVSIAPNGFSFGTPSSLAPGAAGGRNAYPDETRLELADTLQWHVGRQVLMAGGDWSRIQDRIDTLSAEEGAFSYDSGTTNGKDGGLVDWITDYTYSVHAYPNGACPSIVATVHYFCFRSFTQSFGATETQFVTHNVAGFVEDAMRVRRNLLVTLGLRYDYTLLPKPQTENPLLDADIAGIGGAIHGATGTFPEDRNNFGPRLAVVWSPSAVWGLPRRWQPKRGQMFTVRAGYGVFYSHIPGATVRAALVDTALPSTTTHVRIRPTTITQCPQITTVQQGFGYPCAYTSAPPAAVATTTSATVFASGYRIPMVQRGEVAVERALGHRASVRLSYAMAMAIQLPGATDINISPSPGMVSYELQSVDGVLNRYKGLQEGETFEVPLYDQRPIANIGPVTALVSNANATYHAVTVEAQTHGLRWAGLRELELRGSYTYSRSIDYAPQTSATPLLDGQFDPFRNGYDKGLSNQQFPQRFAGTMALPLHERRGPKAVRLVLDGWRVAAIATASSGAPYSYKIFGGTYLKGGRESINGSGGATYLPTIGRNTLRLAPRGKVDLRLGKEVALGHGMHLNAFAEAFNLFNAENISSVETRAFQVGTAKTIGNSTATGPTPLVFQNAAAIATEGLTTEAPFGTPSSSTTGTSRERQLELGVRLQF
ncbi:MAG TPA: TonB-dependent receptor [Acidobacteriaceae bacterium]|nr:TonB-dependent receptor [Acidobacteriaceae bacterium]